MKIQRTCGGIIVTLLIVGCSSKSASVTGNYMLQKNNGIVYLQVTQIGNSIKGYMQDLTPKNDENDGVLLNRVDISGEVEGSTFRINPQSAVTWLQGSTIGGTWGGDEIKLDNADKTKGTVEQEILKRVTVEEWNSKVKTFRDQCAQDAVNWRREKDKQQFIAKLRGQEGEIYSEMRRTWRSLVDDKNGLQQALRALYVENQNVKVMVVRVNRARAADDRAEREAKKSTAYDAEYEAKQVRYAAGQADYQLGVAKYQRDQAQSSVDRLRQDVSGNWQKIAEVNASMDSVQEQLHGLQGDKFPVVKVRYQLGQATKTTYSYLYPDLSSQVLGEATVGWYVAITGRPANGKSADCYSIISETLSVGWIPVADVRVIGEHE